MDEQTKQLKAMGLMDIGKDAPMYIRTNRLGVFQELDTVDKIMDTMKLAIAKVGEAMKLELSKKLPENKVNEFWAIMKTMMDNVCTEQALVGGLKPFLNLFFFHSTKMRLEQEFSLKLQEEIPIVLGTPIDYTLTGRIVRINPETSYAI